MFFIYGDGSNGCLAWPGMVPRVASKIPQSYRAVQTDLKNDPLCYCRARMWLIAIRILTFSRCVKSLYASYNHHFWASSRPQNHFLFAISGSTMANTPMKVNSSTSTAFPLHVVIFLFCIKQGSVAVFSDGITYIPHSPVVYKANSLEQCTLTLSFSGLTI